MAAVIGAIVGGLFTFTSTYYIQKIKIRQTKRSLRRAFIGELRLSNFRSLKSVSEDIDDHLQSALREESDEELDIEWLEVEVASLERQMAENLKSDVYSENLSNIGLFEAKQVDAILRYYHVLDACESEFQELRFHLNNNTLNGGHGSGVVASIWQLQAEKKRLLNVLNASEFEKPDGYAN